jgi:hemerythrin
MEDNLAIIKRIINWHQTIREHVKLVGEAVTDREAMIALGETRTDWIPGRLEILSEKHEKLQQTMSFLDEGLQNHFAYEEKVLPPLLGKLFMRALILDHQEIRKEIGEAKLTVTETRLQGLSREELLSKESDIQQVIDGTLELIEEHANREEIILDMLRRALEEERNTRA